MVAPDYTGRRFGRLVVLFQATEWRRSGKTLWACQCDCGEQTITRAEYLRQDHTRSCGCLQRENRRQFARAPKNLAAAAEWKSLLNILYASVTRFPQPPRVLRQEFEDVWGSCGERRFRRALATLIEQGRIVRTGKRQSSDEDIGSVYSLPRQMRRAA